MRLTRIDETNLRDHYYLESQDDCYFLREYFSEHGFKGETNGIVHNLKISPADLKKNPARRRWRDEATSIAAADFRSAISAEDLARITWVPIPPSKSKSHPDYDNRMDRVLRAAYPSSALDIRHLIIQTVDATADHKTANRISPAELSSILAFDSDALGSAPLRTYVLLIDDVLTTGKHFKCCEAILRRQLPEQSISGIFYARRVLPDPALDFDVLEGF